MAPKQPKPRPPASKPPASKDRTTVEPFPEGAIETQADPLGGEVLVDPPSDAFEVEETAPLMAPDDSFPGSLAAEPSTGDITPPEAHPPPASQSAPTATPSPTPACFLEYAAPDGTQHSRHLQGSTSIGRHTDNDIQLLDPEVSKQHLVIAPGGATGFALKDLGSANGTLINGEESRQKSLVDGDVIVVGNTRLLFRVKAPKPKAARAPRPARRGDRRGPAAAEELTDPPHTGPDTSSPFDEMLGLSENMSGSIPQARSHTAPERTIVTLVPEANERPETTNVFAVPMDDSWKNVDKAKDEKELRRDYERLQVAFDLACSVGVHTNLPALGETILDRILGVLNADTAVIMLRDEEGAFGPLASRVDGGASEVRIPRAIVEQVVRTREGLLTTDAMSDEFLRSSHTVVGQQIRSALCVPLLVREEVFGVIHLSSSSAAGAYESRDLELLRAIAQPAALSVANSRLVRQIEDDAATRAQLSRFLSPALVERAMRRDLSLDTKGDLVQATVLFCDIRGFTAISDGADPAGVVSMLNEYFEAMVEVVFELGGTLDKFIGDELMAVWGTPVQSPDDAWRAVQAAARMRIALENVVNRARESRSEPPIRAGIGIATGAVIAGAMGARRRQDFTVIGDTVNLASRLCSQAVPGQILVCEDTGRECAAKGLDLTPLEPRKVKGVARPVPVLEVPLNIET